MTLKLGERVANLKHLIRGWLPGKPNEAEDLLQLGGDFVLDGQGRLVYAPAPPSRPTGRRPRSWRRRWGAV
jgi:hypothetical protein